MSGTLNIDVKEPIKIHFDPGKLRMENDLDFADFCQLNGDLRIERDSEGNVDIMAPTGGRTGILNSKLTARLTIWAEEDGTGQVFDSSTVLSLPNGARRSPDVSWIRNSPWNALSRREQEEFPPVCPDFVIELRSRTDSLSKLMAKMEEYLDQGATLGLLLDPVVRRGYVYRADSAVEILDNRRSVSGEPLLKDFVLDLESIWG